MKQLDACQQGPSGQARSSEEGGDEGVAPDAEFGDLDVCVDNIFDKYGAMVKDYDQIHPVYLDPTNPNRFLLLTSGNVIKWAGMLG
ncbi:hypothetical protein PCANC_11677 [Puccinia coronata f. sp. avenae]|nr:hypothetical protein PCANC_16644 [Puccinia coronata f. sp. avenae]PLW38174.1 hypothetical protein PCASD_09466 [Puccinia coronata f. sp. avenae]PLW54712.1 hypothetical protein PCANC_11677 [Puccinia coronata f. sp. avenae]